MTTPTQRHSGVLIHLPADASASAADAPDSATATTVSPTEPSRAPDLFEAKPQDDAGGVRLVATIDLDASKALDPSPGTPEWFDEVYRRAGSDPSKIPWGGGEGGVTSPCPMLVSWLNAHAHARVRPGSRVIVVGCGVGDNVVELVDRGYDAVGFDVSPSAIDWARARYPDHAPRFFVGDLFALPTRHRHRYELVVEVYTIQAVPIDRREDAARAIAALCGPRGCVLTIARCRDGHEPLDPHAGPPWPVCCKEMVRLMELGGLRPASPLDDFFDDEQPPKRRLRGVFEPG